MFELEVTPDEVVVPDVVVPDVVPDVVVVPVVEVELDAVVAADWVTPTTRATVRAVPAIAVPPLTRATRRMRRFDEVGSFIPKTMSWGASGGPQPSIKGVLNQDVP